VFTPINLQNLKTRNSKINRDLKGNVIKKIKLINSICLLDYLSTNPNKKMQIPMQKIPNMLNTLQNLSNDIESKDHYRNKKIDNFEDQIRIEKIRNSSNGSRTIYFANNYEYNKRNINYEKTFSHAQSIDESCLSRI